MAADPEASIALPFTPRPQMLTGELVGDVGFDPLGFSEEVSGQGRQITILSGVVHIICMGTSSTTARLVHAASCIHDTNPSSVVLPYPLRLFATSDMQRTHSTLAQCLV